MHLQIQQLCTCELVLTASLLQVWLVLAASASLFHLLLCCVVLYFFLAGFCAQRNKYGLCTCDTQQLHLQTTSQWKSMANHKRIWPGPADFFADVHKMYRLWKRFACPNKKKIVPDLLQRSRICCKEAAFASTKPYLQVRSRICSSTASYLPQLFELKAGDGRG